MAVNHESVARNRGSSEVLIIGLISDTHGLLRAEVLDALKGSDFIVHAGDIGRPDILESLRRLAPVTAVRGNNDNGAWAESLPLTATLELETTRLLVIHDLKTLPSPAAVNDFTVVVSGHSHRPACSERNGVLFINPGSAGPRRFRLPVTLGRLRLAGQKIVPEWQALDGSGKWCRDAG